MRAELRLSGMWEPPGRASQAPRCSGVWHSCGEWGAMRFINPLGWEIVAEDSLGLVDRGRINRYYKCCCECSWLLLYAVAPRGESKATSMAWI